MDGLFLSSIFMGTVVFIYFFIHYSPKIGLVDIPNERSVHTKVIPRGAGIAFVVSVLLSLLFFEFEHFRMYYYIYFAIALIFSAGVWDDARNITPKIKFIFIFFAVLFLYMNDFSLGTLGTYWGYDIGDTNWFYPHGLYFHLHFLQ